MVELIFCTYIWTEQVGKLITVSLKLDEFSWGKDQIPCRLCSKPFNKRHFLYFSTQIFYSRLHGKIRHVK